MNLEGNLDCTNGNIERTMGTVNFEFMSDFVETAIAVYLFYTSHKLKYINFSFSLVVLDDFAKERPTFSKQTIFSPVFLL